jgi:negative regulator of sigma E activity
MTDKEPRKTPIGYEDGPDKPTRGAFRITAIAIGVAAVVCLVLIAGVVLRNGGI